MGAREIGAVATEKQSFAAIIRKSPELRRHSLSHQRRNSQAAQHPALWMPPGVKSFGFTPFLRLILGSSRPAFAAGYAP
jgi:hypothetical protein